MNFLLLKFLFNNGLVINDVKLFINNGIYEINIIYILSVKFIIFSENCYGCWKDDW